ncbi:quinone oxidoreductase family protein [Falsiroseomonas selenitidurans]|uniref:Zinc-binding alcohol dehydrogenase family protein n=1 Tax=Falsiroseomonas selenitidurans TaxID=2716335 RepID=A0ABX1E3M6_9PROT|nr:zinc-binding alcohol dehydrogenase family protein [Falsiroseomonas selenitidurans]NKC31789.1 zinc-binding alcohol dehydrogenase family protein [Falsiroseomonas selenitidurans]
MKAAIIQAFGQAPALGRFREPEAAEGETLVTVTAAPLSPIVRMLAAGRHYTSGGTAGFVPGVDGVGRTADGRRVYFLFPRAPFGSMAQQSVAAHGSTVPVPEAIPDDLAAAIATAGLAAWVALTRRARLRAGETVLVTGANGAAGRMALQVARHLGAARTIAVARSRAKLEGIAADARIALDEDGDTDLRAAFDRGVDIVLDFVWGPPAGRILRAAAANRGARTGEPRLRYVQIGTVAGEEIPLRGDLLRGSGLELMGSGLGSLALAALVAGAGELLAAAPEAGFTPAFISLPLDRIAEAWNGNPAVRYILQPDQS